MKSVIINILVSISFGYIASLLQGVLDTFSISIFLVNNLTTLLVTLLAINSATLGIVLTKIRELIDSNAINANFDNTKREMFFSIKEQIWLIIISLILITLYQSKIIQNHVKIHDMCNVVMIGCFSYALLILYDVAKSVFIILDFKNK